MNPASLAQLMRATGGDAVAIAACMRNSVDCDRLAALVLLDLAPDPLSTLAVFAATNDPPAALRARMRAIAPAALRALHDAPDDDLVDILRSYLDERNSAALMVDLAPPPVLRDACALAGLARLSARFAADAWIAESDDAAQVGGDSLSLDDRRVVLACAAAQRPFDAADLTARIGADGWRIAPDEARRTLLEAVASEARRAAECGAAWGDMRPDERARLARVVSQRPDAAANLIERIGASGWEGAPDEARHALLGALDSDAWSAARSGAAWGDMRPDERLRIARAAAQSPAAAAYLIERIGAEGWTISPDEARQALLDAVANDPWSAATSGAAWGGMRPDERARLARAAAQPPNLPPPQGGEAAAKLIERIGAEGWTISPDEARRALLDAVANDPWSAATSGAAWGGMRPDERARLARAAAQPPNLPPPQGKEAAAKLIERIGAEGWTISPDEARQALLDAVANDPWSAARSGAAWGGMRPDERARLAIAAAQSPTAAAHLIERIGAEGWTISPDEARQTLLNAIANDPPYALQTLIRLIDRLDDEQRTALARAALGGASVVPALAQALAGGCYWRDWMAIFLPAAIDDAEVWDAWRAALRSLDPASLRQALARLPHTVAVALAPRHRTKPPR